MEPTDVVLDAGALTGWAEGQVAVTQYLEACARANRQVLVPAVVIAETTTGHGPRDATTNRRVAAGTVEICDEGVARRAGALRHATDAPKPSTVDAIVAATAEHCGAIVLTGDVDDLERLAAGTRVDVVDFRAPL